MHTELEKGKFIAEDVHYTTFGSLNFEYLGYHISLDKKTGNVHYQLKDSTIEKYEIQIDEAIKYYQKTARTNPRKKNKEVTQKKVSMRHLQPLYREAIS